jgi:hypothetical protein
MAEWLTHVFVGYALFTVIGWSVDWLDANWIAVGIVGSVLPDLNRLDLLVDDALITAITGVPFDWSGLNTLGGVMLLSAIGAMLFERRQQQRRGLLLLLTGGLTHLVVDLPQRYADGLMLTNNYLYPLPPWRVPTPGWYVSADRWVVVVAAAVALLVFLVDRYRPTDSPDERPTRSVQ